MLRVNGWRGWRREGRGCRGWTCEEAVEEEANSFLISSVGRFQASLVSSREQGSTIALAISDFQAFKVRIARVLRMFASNHLYKDPMTDPECMEVGGRFCRKLSTSVSPKLNRPLLLLRGSNMLCGLRRSPPDPSNADRLRYTWMYSGCHKKILNNLPITSF